MNRVILDVDVGTDDYVAILLFLYAQIIGTIKIEAIVCTNGNTSVDSVCVNVIRLLEMVERTDIPVYRGSSRQIIPPEEPINPYNGPDGFGGLDGEREPDMSIVRKEPAAQAINELVEKYPNEITFICLAPLTNMALAIRLYHDFVDKIKEIWVMGGNHLGIGNATPAAEFNFYVDPEAANIVLSSVKKPMTILTWETCLNTTITFDWRFDVFGAKDNETIQLLNRAEKAIYGDKEEFWMPCDAFTAVAFLHPFRFITEKDEYFATVELHDAETRGKMVLDNLDGKEPNVVIIEKINEEIFKVVINNEL